MKRLANAGEVVFFDDTILVLNKSAGILSQPDDSGEACATDLLKTKGFSGFLAPVHRLDRNTTGLLIFARNRESAKALSQQMQTGGIHRIYHAITKGDPGNEGKISLNLQKNPQSNQSIVSEDGKTAVTHFKRIKKFATCSLLEVWLEHGRSHQIRAHFSHLGHALLGDHKYAKGSWAKLFKRPALHAKKIRFPHPKTLKQMSFEVDYPEDFSQLLHLLLSYSH